MKKTRRVVAVLLGAMLVLMSMPMVASAAASVTVVLDGAGTTQVGSDVVVDTDTITIITDANGTANISGDSDGFSVVVVGATTINLADGTIITGAASENGKSGLTVTAGATIIGGGPSVTITGGLGTKLNYEIADTGGYGGNGITSLDTLTIGGTFGSITGGNSEYYYGGDGINAYSDITVVNGASIGPITGGNGGVTGGSKGYGSAGIATGGAFTVNGRVGNISAGSANSDSTSGGMGIRAGSVIIAGTVGDISGGNGCFTNYAITANKLINISGTTGNITAGSGSNSAADAIYLATSNASMSISGTTGNITGGSVTTASADDVRGGNGIYMAGGTGINITGTTGVISGGSVASTGTGEAASGNGFSMFAGVLTIGAGANIPGVKAGTATGGGTNTQGEAIRTNAAMIVTGGTLTADNVFGDLSVSGGSVTIIGTVSGIGDYTGGTVSVNGAQVYPVGSIPVITINTQPAMSTSLTEGSISGSLTVAATVTESATLSYQWYSNTTNSNTGGTVIAGGTGANFTIPVALTVKTYYYYCVVSASGGAADVASTVATVEIYSPPVPLSPSITTTSLPGGTVGTYYNHQFIASGATPITWAVATGSLPNGLALSAAGVVNGTPTNSGNFNFTIKATNTVGTASKSFTIAVANVNPPVTTPVGSFVERLYTVVLGRSSEAAGKKFHGDNLVAKKTDGASTAMDFFLSSEFEKRNLSDSAFLEVCYKTFFDRASDASGKKYWQDWLDKGLGRKYVLQGFINSTEYTKVCKDYGINRGTYTSDEYRDKNPQVTAFVSRLYSECLGRKGEADGLNFYTMHLLTGSVTGKEIARGFIYSAEFDTKNKTSQAKVTAMYKALLGRTPESSGLNFWMPQTKNQIFDGMSASTEFTGICNSYGIRAR